LAGGPVLLVLLAATAAACSRLAASTAAPSPARWPLMSPDGRTSIVIALTDGRLSWHATRAGADVILDSPLGVRRADQAFVEGLTLVRASDERVIDERYGMPHGKRRDHRVHGRERTLVFANAEGATVEVIVRAHDDGVALRYRFPAQTGAVAQTGHGGADAGTRTGAPRALKDAVVKTVIEEATGFHVPEGATGWMLPQQPPHKYGPAYEDFFREVPAGTTAPTPSGWSFPALFKTKGGSWLLITEAGLDSGFCGTRLASEAPGGTYRIRLPEAGEGLGVGDTQPSSALPWTLPWRVVEIGDAAGRILESDLVSDLSPPSRIKNASWVKPGRASWSWWSESDSPKHAERLNAFIDLAAEMGWEYSLVDANWNLMESGRIEDVVAHAREKGVGLLFWYNSGGPNNDVTEAPRDRMYLRDTRRTEFARLKKWGVKGVKIDFWHSDKQDRIRQYREVLEDAAEFGLMVDFHGCTVPRGWSREFPNLVSMEGVFGAEQYKFRDFYPARAAWHNTVLPFTRNAVGPMDFTPVTFGDALYPHKTTNAHELALSVIFESGIQHFADSVQAYRSLPEVPKVLLAQVPAAWDDTRVLSGEPGRSLVIARRAGETWYVAGLNGQDAPETIRVPLDRLAGRGTGGREWIMTLVSDGAAERAFATSSRPVTPRDSIEVPTLARGGFLMRLSRR
jgi:alpha-glucosidase